MPVIKNASVVKDDDGNLVRGGDIYQYRLENSNVDLSTAMTELIVFQRSYSGAAKVMTTSDEMIQKAINMKT